MPINQVVMGSALKRSLLPALGIVLIAMGMAIAGRGIWIHAKALAAQILLESAFSVSIQTGTPVKPWYWADTWPVARIAVPRLNETTIALKGASGQALAFGPGHLDNTPMAGERGTAVYAAHRDTHFAFLKNIEKNDQILVTRSDGKTVSYRVNHMAVMRWDEAKINPDSEGRHLVLATCYPFDAITPGPLRYLVYADMETGGSGD
ncbi:class GN sortase [Ochrobactrum sp. CGA5]|uniref:class GN sortase n=1 Tax=Ochrobactrum sp. CGA5 TaxID=2583453 RepID=UPI0011224375|nr:class GN sortase [Ochrobactrum sp. CGA5]